MQFQFSIENPPSARVIVPRHDINCDYPKTDARKDCNCPKWFYVTPGRHRVSAHTNSWGDAEKRAAAWCREHHPENKKPEYTPKEIAEVVADFLSARTSANLEESTLKKIRTLRDQLITFVQKWNAEHTKPQQLVFIHEIKLEHLTEFVKTWDANMPKRKVHTRECNHAANCDCPEMQEQMSVSSKSKRRGYLVNIFDHAIQKEWIPNTGKTMPQGKKLIPLDNPANFLQLDGKAPRADKKMPLSDRLWDAYMLAIDILMKDYPSQNSPQRTKAFFKLMKVTGFAITDAMISKKSSILHDEEGYYFLRTRKKTDKAVKIHIEDDFYAELMSLPGAHPNYIFWCGPDFDAAGNDPRKIREQETNAADYFAKIWPRLTRLIDPKLLHAELEHDEYDDLILPTPHCLRYNFADEFLFNGGTMEDLAIALGDTTAVAEKHYSKLSARRQKKVTDVIKKSWKKLPRFVQAALSDAGIAVAQA